MALSYKVGSALHWTGVVRAGAVFFERMPNMPERVDQAMKAYASTSLGPMLKESEALEQTLTGAGAFRQLGSRPVFVLTAMAPIPEQALAKLKITADQAKQLKEVWKQMHDEQAAWSSQSRYRLVPDADHYIQFDRPDIVIAAVRSVVDNIRGNQKW